jgi:shikimate kinase
MRLSFIGMSGVGKSYWSSKLVERGFKRFCCDDLIAKKLAPHLTRPDKTTLPMGEWMGFPFDPYYSERQAQYLSYEIEVMLEILDYLETAPVQSNDNIIIDTTGSIIYTGRHILERLKSLTKIVYLSAPASVQEKMRLAYVANPAPVLWGDKFNKKPYESNEAALARCYPELLSYRTNLYEQWMDIEIDYCLLHSEAFCVDDLLELLDTAESEVIQP